MSTDKQVRDSDGTTLGSDAADAATSEVPPAERPPVANLKLLFASLMIVMFLASLSQMVFATALPTIVGELHGVNQMVWVITGYMLASTVAMPIYGKAGDLFGRKNMLLVAIPIFTIGSLIGALAPTMTWLITARVIQGLGGGGLIILSQASVADFIPARRRGKYSGIMGATFATSSVAGPLLGGWLTEGPGWRWVFWIVIPQAIVAGFALVLLMPTTHKQAAVRPKIDVAGICLMALATTGIVLIATLGGHSYEWLSPQILVMAASSLLIGTLFVFIETRAEHPVIPMTMFKNRNFVLVTTTGLLTGICMYGAMGYLPTYFQMAEGVSATEAGLLMVPLMGFLLLGSIAVGNLVSRTGRYKAMPIIGSLLVALALWLLSTVTLATPLAQICSYMALMGIGLGSSMSILTLIVQNELPHRLVGTATAANNYFRQVGSSLGAAIVGSLFVARLGMLLTERLPAAANTADARKSFTPDIVSALPEVIRQIVLHAYNEALVPIYAAMVPLALIAAVLMTFVRENPLATEIVHEAPAESLAEGQLLISDFDSEDERVV
ncbi:MAG: MDR family MFS transporter [Actinomycetota bacterium]|nr:MDR family MFS transporter [Actinomycetota bacterium]